MKKAIIITVVVIFFISAIFISQAEYTGSFSVIDLLRKISLVSREKPEIKILPSSAEEVRAIPPIDIPREEEEKYCMESDGGKHPLRFGAAKSDEIERRDLCSSDGGEVYEAYCSGIRAESELMECPEGTACPEGINECVEDPTIICGDEVCEDGNVDRYCLADCDAPCKSRYCNTKANIYCICPEYGLIAGLSQCVRARG